VFLEKCRNCEKICDFTHPTAHPDQKAAKTTMLEDLLTAVQNPSIVDTLSEMQYIGIYELFGRNVIRAIPDPPGAWYAPAVIDLTMNDEVQDLNWPHLSLVYDVITSFIQNPSFKPEFCEREAKTTLRYIIAMFRTPDSRERAHLVLLLHSFYAKFTGLRSFCVERVAIFFCRFRIENSAPIGVIEILQTLLPIVQGYAVPLAQEHADFFYGKLIPLHSSPHLPFYYQELVQVVVAMIDKDPRLCLPVCEAIADKWPLTSPTKEVLLLNELGILMPWVTIDKEKALLNAVHKIFKTSSAKSNFLVAEQMLMLWNNEDYMRILQHNAMDVFDWMASMVYEVAISHWSVDVRKLAIAVLGSMRRISPEAWESVQGSLRNNNSPAQNVTSIEEIKAKWQSIRRHKSSSNHGK
jgi:serine/threonine-protein phosphatase 2A regulatory subunit B'